MIDFLINIPGTILRVCNSILGNYVLALFLFAVIVEVVMLPFSIKQQKNQIRQAKLRPKEQAIRNKYKGRNDQATQQKVQNEIMEMYQRENFNPMQGCLPLLIQFPIILALYQVVINPLKYICQLSNETITAVNEAIKALPGYESFVARGNETIQQMGIIRDNFSHFTGIEGFSEHIASAADLPNFVVFGGAIDLARTPSFETFDWLIAIPVLTFVFAFFSSKITRKFTYQPTTAENDKSAGCSNAMMDFMMPLMSVYIAFIVPGAIGVYWMFK
ncbi:MAG: membrane protein insertase YidC, partial [Clostridia bacterium]|nr:membrane protein insertase YidC [Clostridia bacterium]